MGLAISHQIIVEKHDGKRSCKSEVGVGTEFAIALPIKPQPLVDSGLGKRSISPVLQEWELENEDTGSSSANLDALQHLPLSTSSSSLPS